jgi:hypothetical protein
LKEDDEAAKKEHKEGEEKSFAAKSKEWLLGKK